jgi:shikimate dehydrogenase
LVVLGDPVSHSLSPAIHNAALSAAGIAGEYSARRVDDDGMRRAINELREGALSGANVTMPHKGLAAELADRLEPRAMRARSVNTLWPEGGSVRGDSTDIDGVITAWAWAGLPEDAPVLVLGSGGAAAAAILALEGRELTVAARRPDRAEALLAALAVDARLASLGVPLPGAVVVNATPVGMRGEAIPTEVVAASSGLFDMAYGSGATPAVRLARDLGLPVADGPDMLLAQAAASFAIWTRVDPPLEEMRAALKQGPE